MIQSLNFQKPSIQPIDAAWIPWGMNVDILRLDLVHPIVSGNKWYKLKYFLTDAINQNKQEIITFGGGWSNHIVATAYACKHMGLLSKGIIRGVYDLNESAPLRDAVAYGMELIFLEKNIYRQSKESYIISGSYVIPEGGLGFPGVKGIMTLSEEIPDLKHYTHIICAAGTGTMAAGLLSITQPGHKLLAVNVTKNNPETEKTILQFSDPKTHNRLVMLEEYHLGGYGKRPLKLLELMRETWYELNLPLDFVYTARVFYALKKEFDKAFFEAGSKVLFIHSGGLQGNRSIPAGLLPYSCL